MTPKELTPNSDTSVCAGKPKILENRKFLGNRNLGGKEIPHYKSNVIPLKWVTASNVYEVLPLLNFNLESQTFCGYFSENEWDNPILLIVHVKHPQWVVEAIFCATDGLHPKKEFPHVVKQFFLNYDKVREARESDFVAMRLSGAM